MGDDEEPRVGVSWMQVAGSALAAVSSAVVLSTLGVAGTVIGAALGSVVATVGSALYTRTLDASRHQVASQAAALRRVARARTELDDVVAARRRGEDVSDTGISRAEQELDEAAEVLAAASAGATDSAGPGGSADPGDHASTGATDPDPARRRSVSGSFAGLPGAVAARLSWKRLAVLAAAVFLVAMVTITAFELVAGRAVSELTGGTDTPTRSTVPGLGRDDRPSRDPSQRPGSDDADPEDDPSTPAGSPGADTSPSADPSDAGEPTDPDPSDSPSPTTSTTVVPTPTPSPGITESPTELPSATATGATGG